MLSKLWMTGAHCCSPWKSKLTFFWIPVLFVRHLPCQEMQQAWDFPPQPFSSIRDLCGYPPPSFKDQEPCFGSHAQLTLPWCLFHHKAEKPCFRCPCEGSPHDLQQFFFFLAFATSAAVLQGDWGSCLQFSLLLTRLLPKGLLPL